MIWSALYIGLLIILTLYFAFSGMVIMGWYRVLEKQPLSKNQNHLSYSIIIPIRNEEKNILKIIEDIKFQDYPKEYFELIVIDDFSEDNSWNLVSAETNENLRLIKNSGKGKKSAIQTALNIAKNEYIIQTDADCRIAQNWLMSINRYINRYKPKLLLAPVIYKKGDSFFSYLQELDFYSLMMTTVGLTGVGSPILANAANLIYPKEIIKNRDLLKLKLCSGDDIFLLHYVKKKYGSNQVHYLNSKEATVTTKSQTSIKSFFMQRIRWASKSRFYKDKQTILVGLLVAIINFLILGLVLGVFVSANNKHLLIVALVAKMLADYALLFPILRFYKRIDLLIYFPFLSLLYPFYISFVGIFSQFIGFEWKGRKY